MEQNTTIVLAEKSGQLLLRAVPYKRANCFSFDLQLFPGITLYSDWSVDPRGWTGVVARRKLGS